MSQLFTVKIPAVAGYPGGGLLVTEPAPAVYLLTISYAPDNRLVAPVCSALLEALDILEARYPIGVVITTSGIPKFYSNGLDLKHTVEFDRREFLAKHLFRLWLRLLSYPMPTIALIPGHAFAGGFMTAMFHDYRVMNPGRGFLCLNELDFGVALQPQMTAIFREKLSPVALRTVALEAKRVSGPEALAMGIVDVLGGINEAMELITSRQLLEKGKTGIYGLMKREMYRQTADMLTLEGYDREVMRTKKIQEETEKEYGARGMRAPKSRL
ncbi:hypothetical protein TD95_004821 [Thielaviopsis punctulata]|uniref:Enoyl-CoA hydratase n=1 Tax=Thielaviopsis punctulata TaxID=72032 RepID=A0A0F4ZF35_9PEZI|nr:hypothetical protein TD95_004821 [Thielaviopsis punctulata]